MQFASANYFTSLVFIIATTLNFDTRSNLSHEKNLLSIFVFLSIVFILISWEIRDFTAKHLENVTGGEGRVLFQRVDSNVNSCQWLNLFTVFYSEKVIVCNAISSYLYIAATFTKHKHRKHSIRWLPAPTSSSSLPSSLYGAWEIIFVLFCFVFKSKFHHWSLSMCPFPIWIY